MQLLSRRWFILGVVSLLAASSLGIAIGLPGQSQSLAQPLAQPLAQSLRVDPVQALIAQQAAERAATLDTLLVTVPGEVPAEQGQGAAQAAGAPRFVRITDAVEAMTIDVPTDWRDIDNGPWLYNGEKVGFYLAASSDLSKFNSDLAAPGVFFGVSTTLLAKYTEQDLLSNEEAMLGGRDKACKKQPKVRYTDPFYRGDYVAFDSCRQQKGHFYFTQVATPTNRAYVIVLRVNLPKGTPPQVLRRIYDSFQVIGEPGLDEHHEPGQHQH